MREKIRERTVRQFPVLFIVSAALLLVFPVFSGLTSNQIAGVKRVSAYTGPKYVPKEVLVKFTSGVRAGDIEKVNLKYGTVIKKVDFGNVHRLRIPWEATVEQMVRQLNKDPAVEYAEPNYIAHALWIPDDEYYSYQWHLDNSEYGGIGMEEAWESSGAPSAPGEGVVVPVIPILELLMPTE